MDPFEDSSKVKTYDEKFCTDCGEIIKKMAKTCPKCGVQQKDPNEVNKAALLLLTFFLGGFGGHKFYLGKYWQGAFYVLFALTLIPGIIALIEFIIYAFTSEERLQEKYSSKGGLIAVVISVVAGFVSFALVGIIAAIAIPQFMVYKERALSNHAESELRLLSQSQDTYFAQEGRYAADLESLNFETINPDVTVEIQDADQSCYTASGKHAEAMEPVTIDCNTY